MIKRNFLRVSAIIVILALIGLMTPVPPFAQAATLTTAADYLNRVKASLTTGVEHTVVFTCATAVSGGAGVNKVILVFPDADDGLWCRTDGTMTVTGSTKDSATSLPGTLAGTCAAGVGASSYDTITVTGVDDLTAIKYGVKIVGLVGELGTPTAATTGIITVKTNNGTSDVDTKDIAVDIIADEQISVTSTVNPTLTFVITDAAIDLGTLTSSATGSDTAEFTVATNAGSGYVADISGTTLTNAASDTITAIGGTKAASSIGSEQFGLNLKDNATPNVGAEPSGGSGAAAGEYATADSFAFLTGDTIASCAGPSDTTTFTISAIANIDGATESGTYTTTLTLVTTGKF